MNQELRKELRLKLRRARKSLTHEQQAFAAQSLLHNFLASGFDQLQRSALYLAADGEIDPASIGHYLWRNGLQTFLPKLEQDQLSFVPYHADSSMAPNKYEIPEPDDALPTRLESLDLILMPLVGFDIMGNRLGMGGGFYDRTLGSLQSLKDNRPKLVGLAYECQKVDQIEIAQWDIPLDAVITDQRIYPFN